MFKVSETDALANATAQAEQNYVVKPHDYLTLEVYTNNGERLIDPDFHLRKEITNQAAMQTEQAQYLVDVQGIAKFPMIGEIKIEGLTLRQAEAILQKEYTKYYQNPFVALTYGNKRVFVLGSPGGQVIPLVNEQMHLVEILALAQGIDEMGKAHSIRVLRGKDVFVIDLSTIEGYLKNNIIMEPGDIIYVEPIRRPLSEGFRDYGPLVSVVTSLTTLIVVLISLR